jgi:DNA-directed RNA polymerase specialized sigma subunit
MIDEAWNARQPEDFNHGQNLQKRDFMRSWDHSRTVKSISLDELCKSGVPLDGDMLYDLPDPRASFETKVLSELQKQQFEATLSDKDRQILRMQYDGCTLKEIAKKTGFQSPSAVYKHIAHIAAQYDDFVGGEYSKYLDKHSK